MTAPQNQKMTYRHELKFLMDLSEAAVLRSNIVSIMEPDANTGPDNCYKIRSLYFDDYMNSAYQEKINGVPYRRKYRIRCYNDKDDFIRLERKIKNGQYISKQSAELTREQTEAIIAGDYEFLLHDPQPLCREFYFECTAKQMRPRVIVDYEREPYVFEHGDVRITFDMNVRAAVLKFDIFDELLPSIPVMDPAHLLLEVKFTGFMPKFIKRMLPSDRHLSLAFSKYIMALEQVMRMQF